MSWIVTWTPTDGEVETARAWDLGTSGVAELADANVAGFADRVDADRFAAEVGGTVGEPSTWDGPPAGSVTVGSVEIIIDAGRSFGHGGHPTTRLLLDRLVDLPLDGRTVLDVGCGSGVLGIAAARLGATVRAVDLDPAAVEATRRNAAANGVTLHVDDTPVEAVDGRFDLVLANLLLADHRAVAPAVAARVAGGGRLAVAGITADQASACAALYATVGPPEPVGRDGDWVALDFRRADS